MLVAIVEPAEVLAAITALKKLSSEPAGTVGRVSNEDSDAGCGHVPLLSLKGTIAQK